MHLVDEKKNFFNYKAGEWDQKITGRHLSQIEKIFFEDFNKLGGPVLDVGCGTGVLIPFINSSLTENNLVVEFDISLDMLNLAKNSSIEFDLTNSINGDAHYLPFNPDSFDTIICFSVYPHFVDKKKVIRELYRCLKKEGKLIILHLKGHRELNAHHNRVGEAVKNDLMIPVAELGENLKEEKFSIIKIEERSDKYLVIAQK